MAQGPADGTGDDGSGDRGSDRHSPGPNRGSDRDLVELGVALLARFTDEELSVADAITRIESVTGHHRTQRRILDAAVERDIIEREGSRIRPTSGAPIDFENEIVTKEGEFTCRRCGTGITTGYFLNLDVGELGPYGSSCIRKITGRE